jgi:uncharacterized protein Yka (UPF0111/DUF47 family)
MRDTARNTVEQIRAALGLAATHTDEQIVRAVAERQQRTAAYQRAINRIDDVLEYRWAAGLSAAEVRREVMGMIDAIRVEQAKEVRS